MYLYLGQETVIKTGDIIGIFDLDNTTVSRLTRDYLAAAQKAEQVVEVTGEIPKSFVVVGNDRKSLVYLSQISPATLRKRANYIKDLRSN